MYLVHPWNRTGPAPAGKAHWGAGGVHGGVQQVPQPVMYLPFGKADIPYIRPTRLFFLPLPLSILQWHETTYCSSGALRQQSSAPCPIPSQSVPTHNPMTKAQVDHFPPRLQSPYAPHQTPLTVAAPPTPTPHFDLNSDLTRDQRQDTTPFVS